MRTFIKRALWGALIGGGIVVFGAAAAQAADTSGDNGLLSGTQALVGLDIPLTVSGTSLSLVGDSTSHDATTGGGTPAPSTAAGTTTTTGSDGTASGTQALIPISIPITVGGDAISVVGDSSSSDAHTVAPAPGATGGTGTASTSGRTGPAAERRSSRP